MKAKEINSAFSDLIKARMENSGINQSELARRTGVSRERINRIVNNISRISLHDFVILGSALDIDITKDLLQKAGLARYIMLTSLEKNLQIYLATVQDMQHYMNEDCSSHQLSQAPSFRQNCQRPKPTSIRPLTASISDLRQLDGVWGPFAFVPYINTDCRSLPMQRKLAQTCGLEGLC